jgi:hypothetical protein
LAVQDRFQNNKKGHKSAEVVKKYGLRLMPELYEYSNPMPYEAAAQMEKHLTEDLRAEDYTVGGGTLGLGHVLGSDTARVLSVSPNRRASFADRAVDSDFHAVLHPQDLRHDDAKESTLAQAFSQALKAPRCTFYEAWPCCFSLRSFSPSQPTPILPDPKLTPGDTFQVPLRTYAFLGTQRRCERYRHGLKSRPTPSME